MANKIKMHFADSTEMFTAPAGYDLDRALLWLGRLNHDSIDRIKARSADIYTLSNGRRGVNARSCVIHVVSQND